MKKGFLFTLDAALALILVIILAAALATQQNALPEKGGISSSLRQQAEDAAIIGFYLNQTGETPPITFSGEYGECTIIYTLDPNNALGTQALPKPPDNPPKIFCEKT
jgi:hypothetical protein